MTVLWPPSPAPGDTYVYEGRVWRFNGTGWRAIGGPTIEVRERRHEYVTPYSYCGTAPWLSAESEAVWEITRIEVLDDGSTVVTRASGVAWDDRLTETYT